MKSFKNFVTEAARPVGQNFSAEHPDNLGGTRNTQEGKDLYWDIEDTLREAFSKEKK